MTELEKGRSGSAHLSQERVEHRTWIGGRIITLLSHYWRDDDPVELTGALGKDWADVLEGLPKDAIQSAAVKYLRENPRKRPTPGAIYEMAREFLPRRPVRKSADVISIVPEPERISAERAAQIMKEVGFSPRSFGGPDDE